MIPVILAGGAGSRLWPLSRKDFPKQLLPVLGSRFSLLQATVDRVMQIPGVESPIIVTNEKYRFIIASQLQELGCDPGRIVLEPEAKNTAPATAVSAFLALQDSAAAELLVLPADHYIADVESFLGSVSEARELSEASSLVTFGVVPDKPETGYGYIKGNNDVKVGELGTAFAIDAFVEKPDLATAAEYVESGRYYWNSGMFMFKAEAFLEELSKYEPEMVDCCRKAVEDAKNDLDFLRLDAAFIDCPAESIDYALMEKTSRGVVVPLECGWSDVGVWSSLHEVGSQDDSGNVFIGDVHMEESRNCYAHSSSRLVVGLGVDNLAIVESQDAVLVSSLDRVQDVKKVVSFLKKAGRKEYETHCKVYRPWGNYESIDSGDRYQVKRIIVYPGQTLSLQKHYHRAEHWVVVKGTAIVTRGDEEMVLTEDQSSYIPLSAVHRLKNPGKVDLELIEVQTGSYLGEDDIVRLDDVYGRSEA